MNKRFVVPLAVALALHAFVLFGFHRPPPPPPPPQGRLIAIPPLKDPIEIVVPPEVNDEPPTAPAGKPNVTHLDDLTPPPLDVQNAITIPVEVRVPNLERVITTELGPPGVPEGQGFRPGDTTLVNAGYLDNPPRTKSQLAPVYPYEARITGQTGEVMVAFVVDESGRVLNPHVLHSNDPIFEAPTLRAVAKWRFEPGRKNGRIVRFRMMVPVAFAVNS